MLRPCVWAALLYVVVVANGAQSACSSWSKRYKQDIPGVCVCNATQCDDVSTEYLELSDRQAGLFQTPKAGDRLAYSTLDVETSSDSEADLIIDTSATYQQILGFGGAFTDATAINVYKMKEAVQQRIVDAYFSDKGLQYTIGRVPIASTDFSESVYSYNPVEDDFEMAHFSIAIDKSNETHKLEFLKRALGVSTREISLFASSWAPPPWMTRENQTENSHMKGVPGEKYWKALALYYSKFIDAYKAENVTFWAMTTQNEPIQQLLAIREWQSLRFTTQEERDFVKKDLGPLMKKNHPDLQIIIFDDQKDELLDWNASFIDAEAKEYVAGVGVHWYKNLDFLDEASGHFENLAAFHERHPDVFILPTEACEGYLVEGIGTGAGPKLLEANVTWQRGEIYARDIINDLANYAAGWTDWNMVLDTTGGPNWAKNLVDAPILVDEESGGEFYKQPMFYVMGHVAKFVPPGSHRIALNLSASAVNSTTQLLKRVDRVAFLTPEHQVVVVLSNRNAEEVVLKLRDVQKGQHLSLRLPGNAIQTLLWASPSHETSENISSPSPSAANLHSPGCFKSAAALFVGIATSLLL
ncbi:hypothetical protein Poli38472_005062 [Pythium oligandrum]|uniref:Glucosylceramidase n=1 Tax=Pythium oligandrum TaxID=41045 RepID=A0A8K1FIU9_PYTOL|nr:hypothetical protein Poli38472_005062 [Pythium oligandrum]|eukprot:TMW62444.1 hypothetical protein Poli38472_005062 [Pythium oligandrum]